MSLARYDRFVFWCDPGSREHSVMENGIIECRPQGDHFDRVIKSHVPLMRPYFCSIGQNNFVPTTVADIETALAAPQALCAVRRPVRL
jgi:hypothetical protein